MASESETHEPPALGGSGYSGIELTEADRTFYAKVANDTTGRNLVQEFVVPKTMGKGFIVKKGQILRVSCDQGPQVADFGVFNRTDPQEAFSASQTRLMHGCHVTVGHRLWSHALYQRPLMSIIADSLADHSAKDGLLPHDVMFGPCDETHYFRLTGKHGMPNCRNNLAQAIEPFGLGPQDVPDPLNIFMVTGVNENDRLFYTPPNAGSGDFMELYAEMDVICAISACPGASSGTGPGGLRLEVFDTPVQR